MNPFVSKILLIRELICTEDLKTIVLSIIYIDNITDFEYGRYYQIVADRSKYIYETKYIKRRENIIHYMNTGSVDQIIGECLLIILEAKIKPKSNDWYDITMSISIHNEVYDDFYIGRCIQFILDTNNNIKASELVNMEEKDLVFKAHEMKTRLLLVKDGIDIEFKGCDYCDTWTVGDKRCSCGNRRCFLDYNLLTSLDDTNIVSGVECY